MAQWLDPLAVVVVLLNFVALGASRLRTVIRAVAVQGVLLGVMMFLAHGGFSISLCLVAKSSRP